jgi:hypothetical protein
MSTLKGNDTMKDSTVFILLGLLCMVWVLFCAVVNAPLTIMGGFCIMGTILLGFGFGFLANDK